MHKMRSVLLAVLASSIMTVTIAPSAQACGFVGCLVNKVAPGVGTALDHANAAAGNPFDHAVTSAMNAYAPGSGTAVEAYWAARNAGLVPNVPNGRFQAAPGMGGNPMTPVSTTGGGYGGGGYVMGNFCLTPVGVFGPGPVNPVGSTCNIINAYGQMILGQVTQ